jgi:hypothetical protein
MEFRPFIDFYENIGFAPTGTIDVQKKLNLQILKDLLYIKLGVSNFQIMNMQILEIGPGSGENLVRLIEKGPKKLDILDGSKKVINNLKSVIDFKTVEHEFILADAENYKSNTKYNLVIAEGMICFQINPVEMYRNISNLVSKDGILIITTSDEFSIFSEIVRRFLAKTIFLNLTLTDQMLNKVNEFFSQDFKHLPGMTRDQKHWILDSIFSPWGGELFTVRDALEAIEKDFKFLSSSPYFIEDWRWYKDPTYLLEIENHNFEIDFYMKNCINFLDHRFTVKPIEIETYKVLSALLKKFYYDVREFVVNDVDYSILDFNLFIKELLSHSKYFHDETNLSIKSLLDWSESKKIEDLEHFRELWGRGQQFMSLLRRV